MRETSTSVKKGLVEHDGEGASEQSNSAFSEDCFDRGYSLICLVNTTEAIGWRCCRESSKGYEVNLTNELRSVCGQIIIKVLSMNAEMAPVAIFDGQIFEVFFRTVSSEQPTTSRPGLFVRVPHATVRPCLRQPGVMSEALNDDSFLPERGFLIRGFRNQQV